ncbi:MAG: type II toxin-antitoxin system HicB family antitoxin [Anaerolineae bacterium]|nr:type II toxin-antitoxin system HicB family antitoxin [Anaerolineae bacterium]
MDHLELERQAKALAALDYSVLISLDDTVQGERVILAAHPDLPGCMSDGLTLDEALENLADARYEYILSLLEDGLPVPEPARPESTSTSTRGDGFVSQVEVDVTLGRTAPWVYDPSDVADEDQRANQSVFASKTLTAS